jgi:glutaredoxin-like protein NrdH
MITLYTKPGCPACAGTERALDRLGIEHVVIDITADPQALACVHSLGYSSAPVVVAGDQSWCGFRPDRISALKGIS